MCFSIQCFNRGNNWAVVTPIYKTCMPSCSLSREEFKCICVVPVFQFIHYIRAFVHACSKRVF